MFMEKQMFTGAQLLLADSVLKTSIDIIGNKESNTIYIYIYKHVRNQVNISIQKYLYFHTKNDWYVL